MAITLTTAQTNLDAWVTADAALAEAQSYSITTGGGSRTLTRSNAKEVRDQINYWQRIVNELTAKAAGSKTSFAAVAKFT